ncbi:hypothetical protein [Variovorax sp. WS11]|uniref:hypothetical protein n=1 Tax=Variovorax sp. WS11 TaxID=1105204 RepID=UPI0031BA8DB2
MDPWRIAQMGMAAPELGLEGVIVLVDAAAVMGQRGIRCWRIRWSGRFGRPIWW